MSNAENKKDMKVIISSVVVVGFLALAGSAYVCWKFFAKHRGNELNYELFSYKKYH